MKKLTNKITHFNTQKGITLVALVITIIVLLILAGVAINMAINSDGLFGKANEAVDKYGEARKNESTAISDLFDILTELETGIKVEQVTDAKPGELEGSGTEVDPYTINSIEDLVFFAYDVRQGNTYADKTVKLATNLDFDSTKSYVDAYRKDYAEYGYNGELKTLLTTGQGFIPIGTPNNVSYTEKSFCGTFNGNGKILSSLYINMSMEDNTNDLRIGLFGNNYGTIKNLGIINCNISGRLKTTGTNSSIVGGITAYNYGMIDSCFADGKISSINTDQARSGGIAGTSANSVSNCYNKVACEAEGTIAISAGIVGQANTGTTITNCYNVGDIVSTGTSEQWPVYSAGITGLSYGIIENTYNLGKIQTKGIAKNSSVGGIVGLSHSNINNSHNTGEISSIVNTQDQLLGEIVGYLNETATTTNCNYKTGNVNNGIGLTYGSADGTSATDNMPEIITVVGEKFKAGTSNNYPTLNWE